MITRRSLLVSAAVGAGSQEHRAVMAVTTETPVPADLIAEILTLEGFDDGRAVDL